MRKTIPLLFFFLAVCLVETAHAQFEFTEVPTYIDNQLGVGVFVGGLLASLVLLCVIMFPLMILTKGRAYSLYILFSMITLAPLVGLGWFPIWIYIIIVLLIALKFGKEFANFLGGIGK